MRSFALLLTVAACGYVALCAFYYFAQDALLFQGAAPVAPDAPALDVRFDVPGIRLAGYVVNPDAPVDVVYFGGNAEPVAANAGRFAAITRARTLLVDYRGYGRSPGRPSQAAWVDDATRYVREFRAGRRGQLLLVGHSLGTGVAALAAARLAPEVDALVLVSPFSSLTRVARAQLPWLPVAYLLRHPFDVASVVDTLPRRVTVVIATDDRVIAPDESRRFVGLLPTRPTVVELEGAGHNGALARDATWQAIAAVVDALDE